MISEILSTLRISSNFIPNKVSSILKIKWLFFSPTGQHKKQQEQM